MSSPAKSVTFRPDTSVLENGHVVTFVALSNLTSQCIHYPDMGSTQ